VKGKGGNGKAETAAVPQAAATTSRASTTAARPLREAVVDVVYLNFKAHVLGFISDDGQHGHRVHIQLFQPHRAVRQRSLQEVADPNRRNVHALGHCYIFL